MHGTFLEAPPRGSTGLQYTDSICGNYLYDIFAPHRHKTDKSVCESQNEVRNFLSLGEDQSGVTLSSSLYPGGFIIFNDPGSCYSGGSSVSRTYKVVIFQYAHMLPTSLAEFHLDEVRALRRPVQ
jgi:hypothetical protein